jgi:hypothetical protein
VRIDDPGGDTFRLRRFAIASSVAMNFNINKCLAKVAWQCAPGTTKQCSRTPKPGHNLCGIHLANQPHGLVADPVEAAMREGEGSEPPAIREELPSGAMPAVHAEEEEVESTGANEDFDMYVDEAAEDDEPAPGEADEDEFPPAKVAKTSAGTPTTVLAKVPGKTATAKFDFTHLGQYLQHTRTDGLTKHLDTMKHYSDFCVQIPGNLLPAHCQPFVETASGPISLHEDIVKAYLTQLRFQGESLTSQVMPSGYVGHIAKSFKQLQDGIKDCGLDSADVPGWAEQATKSITQLMRDWKKVDMPNEMPAARRLFITADTIEDYCIRVIIRNMEGTASLQDIEDSLLLRVQTARSHRHVNLPGLLTFADTGSEAAASDGEPIPFMHILCTKPLGSLTVQGIANAKGRVKLLITDAITLSLWRLWADGPWESEVPKEKAFVFPKQFRDAFVWDQAMPRSQHDKAVQKCARVMSLGLTEPEVNQLTSKAVRSGVSAGVAREVRDVVNGKNRSLGRSASSKMDIGVYTPKEVLMEPGPLHGDTEGIAAKLEQAISEHFAPLQDQLLCPACGFPHCECGACNNRKGRHSCWLAGRVGPKPKNGYKENNEQAVLRMSAWKSFGVHGVPAWVGSSYAW